VTTLLPRASAIAKGHLPLVIAERGAVALAHKSFAGPRQAHQSFAGPTRAHSFCVLIHKTAAGVYRL